MSTNPSLDSFWTDGAVIQRDRPIPLRGGADPGTALVISLAGMSLTTTADAEGRFELLFDPLPAGGPFELVINGEVLARDLYAGELWFAAGQSNMELPLDRTGRWPGDWRHVPGNRLLRVLRAPIRPSFEGPAQRLPGARWVAGDSPELSNMPALSYHFARLLNEKLGVAVGIINLAVGGSPIRAWLPPAYCEGVKRYRDEYHAAPSPSGREETVAKEQERASRWYTDLDEADVLLQKGEGAGDWKPCLLPASWEECGVGNEAGSVWFRKKITLPEGVDGEPGRLLLGAIIDSDRA